MELNRRQTPATTSTADSNDPPRRPPSQNCLQPRRMSSKRTRDLPDLSECHSCRFRTDSCSGDDVLLILYSQWRIVLLCDFCCERVESSQICSYCFKEPSGTASCFTCGQCHRIVHESCFSRYRTSPPWSYSSSGSGFSVCVDCWLPVTVARKRGLLVRRSMRKGKDASALGDSNGDCREKDANSLVFKKFDSAFRNNEPRRAVELASNVLNFIADRDVSCDSIKYNTNDVGLDVTGLALQSNRSMDNSSGVLDNLCSVNLDSVSVPKMHVNNHIHKPMIRFTYSTYSRCRSISRKGKVFHDRGENISQPSISIMSSNHDSTTSPDSLKTNGIGGVATGACPKVANGEVQLEEQEESFSCRFTGDQVVDNGMNAASALLSEEDESTAPEDERSNEKRSDRFMMRYSRRKLNERLVLD
uniref:Uncharacterized protein LOC107421509 n=1 Tax=Rhizophora mucronata TaxID=61149 RepID=A0A2P2QN49_RHIMU